MSIVNLKSPTDLSGFYVVYKGSTNLEKKGIYGISHLMEHLVCKSLDPYQDELQTLGIDFNAYTSSNEIVFYLKGLDENLSEWRNKFLDLLGQFEVTKEEFENERNIVLQEYMDSFNDQTSNHWLNLFRKRYNLFSPIGLKEDLESLTFMDCLKFFEKQYVIPSKVINVSKNIEFGADMDFKEVEYTKTIKEGNYPVEIQRDNEYKGKVSLIMPSKLITEDVSEIKFVDNMFASGLQSPFYQEIREKRGLVYYIGLSSHRIDSSAINLINTMTTSENVDKIIKIIDTIFKNPTKFLTKERFDIIKKSLEIEKKKKDINRYSSVTQWIEPEGWSVFDCLDTITYDKAIEISKKHFNMEDFYVSRDDKEFS